MQWAFSEIQNYVNVMLTADHKEAAHQKKYPDIKTSASVRILGILGAVYMRS